MTWRLDWSSRAAHDLQGLPVATSDRIVAKMDWYIAQKEPFHFAERLSGSFMGLYRFRVGNYRVLCDVVHGQISVIEVLAVRHRKDAYR